MSSVERYKKFRGYKFDRWIFKASMWIIFAVLIFIAVSNKFDLDYFNCPLNADGSIHANSWLMMRGFEEEETRGYCKNPFYRQPNWKNEEYLYPGEYGKKPGLLFEFIYLITGGVLAAAFLINHLIYNRKFKFNEAEE